MPTFAVALSWIILSPIAFLANVVCIAFVLHYQPLFHSCDVALISLLVTMAANAVFLFPVQAVVELGGGDLAWGRELCTFYVWLSVTLRASNLLVLLVINVYWMASLRVTLRGQLFTTSKSAKMCVCMCWLVSVLLGIIPATGGTDMFPYFTDGACKFLPANTSYGFALVFIILPLLSFIMSLISSVDSWLLFRHIRLLVLSRLNAGRLRATNSTSGAQHAAHGSHNELNVSMDLCRLVIAFTVVSSALNGLPLMVSQFVQMIQDHDRVAMETTLLYLLLMEALVVPHLLWLLSDRYRHAAYYTWKVFLVRDQSYREEDAAACVLQAFRFQAKNVTARSHTNGNGPPKSNGNANSVQGNELSTITSPESTLDRNGHPQRPNSLSGASGAARGRVRTIMTTDLDDGMTVITQVTASSSPEQDGYVFQSLAVPELNEPREVKTKVAPKKSPRNFTGVKKVEANGCSVLVSKETLQQVISSDVERSSSRSRQGWKDKMRKKFLPPVLLDETSDEGLKASDLKLESDYADIEPFNEIIPRKVVVTQSPSIDSNYYISGDYHYSYLGDSGVSATLRREMTLQEDGSYESCDIVSVLDVAHGAEAYHQVHEDIYAQPMKLPSSDIAPEVNVVSKDMSRDHEADIGSGAETSPVIHEVNSTSLPEITGNEYPTVMSNNQFNVIGIEFEDGEEEILAELRAEMQADKPKDMIENTSTLKSLIRRDNYRKFLPYTNLVVSSVDVEDDQAVHLPVSNIDVTPAGQVDSNEVKDVDLATSAVMIDPDVVQTGEVTITSPTQDAGSHPLVDYNHLETVSGTEMLLLKMKKVRQAIAMDSTDDSNYSANSSNDWSSDTNDHSSQQPSTNVTLDYMSTAPLKTLQENSESNSQLKQVSDITLKNPVLKSAVKSSGLSENVRGNAVEINPINTNSFNYEPALDNAQRFKQVKYANNPFLTESFELRQTSAINPNTISTNPFFSPNDIFIGPEVISSYFTSVPDNSARAPESRLQKSRQNSVKKRHTSSEDELDSIFEERLMGSNGSSDNPFSPTESQVKNDESDSDASDRSVIIKPYGRRRPAWMEDPLMTTSQGDSYADQLTSESDTDTLGDSNHFTTFSVTVTDDISDGVVEYDFDAVNIGGVSSNDSYKTMSYLKALSAQPNLVQYHFNEDIDRGFEDALAASYVSQGHTFGGLGLCFESIKEEPEESLSESLTSLDGTELSDSKNIFKTQAVVSRPSSRTSVTSPELSFPPHVLYQDNFDATTEKNFPTFERTSADGSDDVLHDANVNYTPPKNPLDPWGFALPVALQKQGALTLASQFSADFQNEAIEIERADDIVTSIAFQPERSSPFDHADWPGETLLTPPDPYQNPTAKKSATLPNSANPRNVSFNTNINSAYF